MVSRKELPDEKSCFRLIESLVLDLLDELGERGLSSEAERILRSLRRTTNELVHARYRDRVWVTDSGPSDDHD